MLPLKDNNPTRTFPYITIILIVLNGLVFINQLLLNPAAEKMFIYSFGAIPYEFKAMERVVPFRPFPFPLSIFTSMFVHGNLLHILGNMLYLWIFGDNIEDRVGHGSFVFFYLLCGLIGAATHISLSPNSTVPMIGASGAISGIMGAYMLLYPHAKVSTLIFFGFFIRIVELPAVFVLGYWILIQLLNGSQMLGLNLPGGVAWFAHIGGFLGGLFLVPFLDKGKYT
ncbi:MAG: rhomboid family intramembrane serine protease [Candidatus Schekmanbacteria bacterium]|nr:rhomboid family intramembrane serine protease [Candidatus Schekmanbacteria bacterium]